MAFNPPQVNQRVRFASNGSRAVYFHGYVTQVLKHGYCMVKDQTDRPPRPVRIDRLEIIRDRFAGSVGRM